jgi:hypothetical protein
MKWYHRKRCCTSSTKRSSWKYTHKGSASDSFWIIIKTMEDIRKTITDVGGIKTPWRKTDRYKSR